MAMTRSIEEILVRIKAVEADDWMGTQRSDLLGYLPFEAAKPFLKPEATAEDWTVTTIDPISKIVDYLPFAWGKASDCRGLSAGRSLDHMKAWLWLAGLDVLLPHLDHYTHYGKAQLVMCSALVGFDWRPHDVGGWVTREYGAEMPRDQVEAVAAQFTAYAAPFASACAA